MERYSVYRLCLTRVARNSLVNDNPVALEFRIELEFRRAVEGGNMKNNPRSKDENQQQTQSIYDAGCGNRTRATLVGSEGSRHCVIYAIVLCIPF